MRHCSLSALIDSHEKIFFMPANLNALIRYKQIDKCLKNRFVDCTIQKMQEMCSEALAEYRGKYKMISERTIRDDIRVMRSEMLGFNAPIVFEDGRYFYSDPDYSIFQMTIHEKKLLVEVGQILAKERDKISGPEVDALLQRIIEITGEELIPKDTSKPPHPGKVKLHDKLASINRSSISYSLPPDGLKEEDPIKRGLRKLAERRERNTVYWGYVMELL